ncbi:hypothetical protein BD289DRAFT_12747 [Coniella lustricola]|uniref:Uncharacterized protein n=1 Tax=Coniella lustricola TaxID=2025994 RepID=A0A2T3A4D3_9PEZI|nr:hypothetical protein BD289DRAFT_12747 [Coniella lustricola]
MSEPQGAESKRKTDDALHMARSARECRRRESSSFFVAENCKCVNAGEIPTFCFCFCFCFWYCPLPDKKRVWSRSAAPSSAHAQSYNLCLGCFLNSLLLMLFYLLGIRLQRGQSWLHRILRRKAQVQDNLEDFACVHSKTDTLNSLDRYLERFMHAIRALQNGVLLEFIILTISATSELDTKNDPVND